MPDIIGIDHIYITVSDMGRSEIFYDALMPVLGFRKNDFAIGGERHIQYFNRFFGYVLRPARGVAMHDPYTPGLHHLCLRVATENDVVDAADLLKKAGIPVSDPKAFPDYAPDYVAAFIADPDGIRIEITNYRLERRQRHDNWHNIERDAL